MSNGSYDIRWAGTTDFVETVQIWLQRPLGESYAVFFVFNADGVECLVIVGHGLWMHRANYMDTS